MPKARIVKLDWGTDPLNEFWTHVEENVEYWLNRTRNYRENTLKEYARLYKGTPIEKEKNTPWPNAANNVIQIIATDSDQLLSRVMAIYMIDPLWACKLYGDFEVPSGISAEDMRLELERFLIDMAMDSTELDFYRVEQAWFSSAIRNGTGVIKLPWEYTVESQLADLPGGNITGETAQFADLIKYDGPRPANVPMNKFVTNLNFTKLEDSNFKFEIVTVNRYQLEERKQWEIFDAKKLDIIISHPDRQGKAVLQEWLLENQGITDYVGSSGLTSSDEYDLVEGQCTYWHNGKKFSVMFTWHHSTKTRVLAYYNYYPDNMCIFEDAKLAYDDDQYLGYGFAEMLQGYQDEITTAHNQRTDAGTLNNTTAFRVNKNSKLHSILTFYPGVMVPADKDEIERLDTSNAHAQDTNSETLTRGYAKERSGVDSAMGGAGGGIVNQKRGIYSSQGTFSVMQQQNNRTSLRTSDMRSAHTRAGVKFAKMYSYFGLGNKIRSYGDNAEKIKEALKAIKSGKLGLIIRPASASINKDIERQNDILMSQTLEKLYAGDAQIIQSLTTAGMPKELSEYYMEVLKAKNSLMRHILRNFGHDDVERLIPVPSFLKENKNAGSIGNGAPTQSLGSGNGGAGGVQNANPQEGAGVGTVPVGDGQSSNQLPT